MFMVHCNFVMYVYFWLVYVYGTNKEANLDKKLFMYSRIKKE